MAADDPRVANEELQFDRVAAATPATDAASAAPAVNCVVCKTPVKTDYFHINGKTTCERCKNRVLASTSVPKGIGTMGKAIALGLLAAIAGAVLYYGVIKITNFEIGIVAIAIGYMVGWAVQKATLGKGGRRFQILAVLLTYWSVGMAYAPLAFQGRVGHAKKSASAVVTSPPDSAASASATGGDSVTVAADHPAQKKGNVSLLLSFGALFLLTFALPVLMIVGSMPSGILSAFIIFIGMRQAWRMTAAPVYKVSGPYRIGAGPSTASA